MKNLNLDNEHFPMVEDDAHHDCQLCKYNIDFLDSHLELLAGKTSKSNMYKILFEIFETTKYRAPIAHFFATVHAPL